MKNYKAPDNTLHCIEPEFAHLLPEGCVQISDEEAETIRAANAPVPTYKDLRIAEYAKKSIGEQLDMQYRDMVNGTTLWRDWIASIKAQFPKA